MEEANSSHTEKLLEKDVRTVAKGGIITLFGSLFGKGIDLGLMIWLARLLDPYEYGLYIIGLNVLRILGLIAPFGLNRGVVRFGLRNAQPNKPVIVTSLKLSLLTGAIIGLLVFILSPWLAHLFNDPELANIFRTVSFTVPFLGIMIVAVGATTISKQMKYAILSRDITQPLINALLVAIFIFFKIDAFKATLATAISFLCGLIIALYFLNKLFGSETQPIHSNQDIKPIQISELMRFSLWATLAGVVVNLTNRTDRLMVGYLLSIEEAGVYHSAAQSATLLLIVMGAMNGIFIPMIVDFYEKKDYESLNQLYKIVTRWTLYASLPAAIVFCFAASSFMQVIYGAEYVLGSTALILITVAQLINAGTGAVGPILIMTGHQAFWFFLSFGSLILNIVLNWWAIPRYGLAGAAASSIITICILYFLGLLFARQRLNIWPYDRSYKKGVIATLSTILIVWLVRSWALSVSVEFHLAITIALSFLTFTIMLTLQGLEQEDQQFIDILRRRAKK